MLSSRPTAFAEKDTHRTSVAGRILCRAYRDEEAAYRDEEAGSILAAAPSDVGEDVHAPDGQKSRMREEFGRGCRLLAPSKKVEHLPLGWDACQCWVYEETGRAGRVCLIGHKYCPVVSADRAIQVYAVCTLDSLLGFILM